MDFDENLDAHDLKAPNSIGIAVVRGLGARQAFGLRRIVTTSTLCSYLHYAAFVDFVGRAAPTNDRYSLTIARKPPFRFRPRLCENVGWVRILKD
jgi:hypothetical protein